MYFLSHFKRFLQGSPSAVITAVPIPLQPGALPAQEQPWDATVGLVAHSHQERTLSVHNSEVVGQCSGAIQQLSGSTMVCAFEDLPTWMSSLLVNLWVESAEGLLTVTLHRADGTAVPVTAPCSLEAEVALSNGRFCFKCQADSELVRGIHYQVRII